MGESSIVAILQKVLDGDVEAYVEIVRLYQQDVWKVAAAMLHDRGRTEDIVQQVFVDAYRSLETFEPGGDFQRWIKAIARNRVRRELRRSIREDRRLEIYRGYLAERLRDEAVASRYDDLREEALRRCREGLPEQYARAIELRYARSLEFDEMAETLGRTVAAARQTLSRARLWLRDCIERRMVGA